MTEITTEMLHERLNYNPETGILTWKVAVSNNVRIGDVAGNYSRGKGYVIINWGHKPYRAHRIIWKMQTGEWPIEQIDHKDRDGFNNRWDNLREATYEQNNSNRRSVRPLGLRGAYFDKAKNRWRALIHEDGKTRHLGYHDSEVQAHNAYFARAQKIHGEFASVS